MKPITLLAIETSCDETAAAVLRYTDGAITVLGEAVSSQIALHAPYGGVVPNLAAREHVQNIVPVVESALKAAALTPHAFDCLAVTQGPGLIPALLVGATAAKTLALTWNKPLIGINHLEGHIYANFINQTTEDRNLKLEKIRKLEIPTVSEDQSSIIDHQSSPFPLLALIVSGGHTQLVLMRDHFQYELLGETEDDAAGEAFDKVAKMLGLPYPGGPEIGKRADAFRTKHSTHSLKEKLFPRPKLNNKDYHFSFSGLKTAVLYFLKEHQDRIDDESFVAEVAHQFQEAVVDVLIEKTKRAIEEFQPKTIIIAGGVSANQRLRERMTETVAQYPDTKFRMPPFEYSLDNAAMIGAAGILRFAAMDVSERQALKQNAFELEPSAHFPLTKH